MCGRRLCNLSFVLMALWLISHRRNFWVEIYPFSVKREGFGAAPSPKSIAKDLVEKNFFVRIPNPFISCGGQPNSIKNVHESHPTFKFIFFKVPFVCDGPSLLFIPTIVNGGQLVSGQCVGVELRKKD